MTCRVTENGLLSIKGQYRLMSWRVKLIRKVTRITDLLTFYPKLKAYYKNYIAEGTPLVLDVGCNRGQSIDLFLSINKNVRVIAFEPNKRLFDALVSKYADNKNIRIHNLGVSDKAGHLTFNENIFDETSTFEPINYDSDYLKKKAKILGVTPAEVVSKSYKVEVIDLDSFIRKEQLDQIDVVKIDVEGHEFACLKGLFPNNKSAAQIGILQLERHFDDMYDLKDSNDAKTDLLNSCSFDLAYSVKNKLADYEELLYINKDYKSNSTV